MLSLFWGIGPAIVCWLLLKQWYEEAPGSWLWRQIYHKASDRTGSFWGDPGQD